MNLKGMNLMNFKKVISIILMAAILATSGVFASDNTAEAAVINIKVDAFAKALANSIGLQPVAGTQKSTYVNALIEKGIIKDGDFTSYTSYLTRTDGAVLLNRADEYLYGDTLDTDLVNLALEKRISDINSIKESKRIDVVKCYLKGYIKGYSNGDYSTDRAWKGSSKLSKAGALNCIKMLKNPSLREKISPDGQLIRTTKLPKNAKLYPYILASYPNSYYEWKFLYDGSSAEIYNPKTGRMEDVPFVYLTDYASPTDVDKMTRIDNFAEVKKERLDIWVNKVKTHMESILNVDYRNIDEKWVDTVLGTSYTYGYWGSEDNTRKRINAYVKNMKENKTVIECDKVAVDGSTLYYFDGVYYLRVYARYRIVSSKTKYEARHLYETFNLMYTNYPFGFNEYVLGKWRTCCFDVVLTNNKDSERENLGVSNVMFIENDYMNRKIK